MGDEKHQSVYSACINLHAAWNLLRCVLLSALCRCCGFRKIRACSFGFFFKDWVEGTLYTLFGTRLDAVIVLSARRRRKSWKFGKNEAKITKSKNWEGLESIESSRVLHLNSRSKKGKLKQQLIVQNIKWNLEISFSVSHFLSPCCLSINTVNKIGNYFSLSNFSCVSIKMFSMPLHVRVQNYRKSFCCFRLFWCLIFHLSRFEYSIRLAEFIGRDDLNSWTI